MVGAHFEVETKKKWRRKNDKERGEDYVSQQVDGRFVDGYTSLTPHTESWENLIKKTQDKEECRTKMRTIKDMIDVTTIMQ